MTANFNYDPYYDDFNEDKNFMRILFKPGYAVQGRELTQLQTIIANQMERFGNHIFKNGSPIVGGKVSLDDRANYIILESQYGGSDIVPEDFEDKTIVAYNSSKSTRARVIAVDTSVAASPVLVIKYLSGDVFSESDELQIYGQNTFAKLRSSNAVGRSYVASIQDGVYYFKGSFVKVEPQFLVLETFYRQGYNSTTNLVNPSYKIGIQFDETITDSIDDTSLLDPAQGSFNYQAPGADRYTINTVLSKRTLDSADTSSFFEVLRIVNGVKTKEIDYPIYSEIEKTLARRTYDESGNYTVDPFVISMEEGDSANGMFNIVLDPGKAYVGGYEFTTTGPTTIELERARETSSVQDYDIVTNYESSVVLDHIVGSLSIGDFPSLDIHCVPGASVSSATSPAYNSTKIGSLNASMMRYNDSTNTANGRTHSFTVNVFNINTTPITGTLPVGSTSTTIKLPANWSGTQSANAYANMYFQITNGAGLEVTPIRVVSSNTSSLILESALPFTPGANTIRLTSDFKTCKSLVGNTGSYVYFTGDINSDSIDVATGSAYISEPTRSSKVFALPYTAIEPDSMADTDLYVRKVYSKSSTGGVFTIDTNVTGDSFPCAGIAGVIPDSLLLNDIVCTVKTGANASLGIVANNIVGLANNNFTVTAVSNTRITVDLGDDTTSYTADFIIKTKVNNIENSSYGYVRNKTMYPTTTEHHAKVPTYIDSTNALSVANSAYTAFTGGSVYTVAGATYFNETSVLTDLKTPGKSVSLQISDVYEIVRITDSKSKTLNVTTAMLSDDAHDITSHYDFDNGQKKSHYDHASIRLKRGYSAPVGKVFVQYRYLKHSASPSGVGVYTVDSYLGTSSNMTYADIASFNNKEDGQLLSLRGSFDFRPARDVASNTYSGTLCPDTLSSLTTSLNYYMPRIDQVVVKQSKDFAVITGKSAISPVPAAVDEKDMLIYTLYLPAYTESVKDVRADFKNHRRYRMQDINAFNDRLNRLEYYVSLNSLERNATSSKILDSNGLERSKYGILVDNFTTRDVQASTKDVGFDSRNLIENGELKAASLMRTVNMTANTALSSGATKISGVGDKKVMSLSYTTDELAKQPYATNSIPIAQALFANFRGSTKLFPEFVGDVDTGSTAKVVLNSTQGIDNAFNFLNDALKYISDKTPQWANDVNSPFAQIADSQWYKTIQSTRREDVQIRDFENGVAGAGIWQVVNVTTDSNVIAAGAGISQKQISTSSSQVDVGTFVTDLAIQPYIKPRGIVFTSAGLRSNTNFYSYFDDTDVNNYISAPDRITLNASSTLINGETLIIGQNLTDVANGVASLLSGNSNFSICTVACNDHGTTNVEIVNESGIPLTNSYVFALDSGKYYRISSVGTHRTAKGVITSSTIVLSTDASATNDYYNGNTITVVRTWDSNNLEESQFAGVGESYTITDYVGSTRTATLSSAPQSQGNVVYRIGNNKSDRHGQLGGIFYVPPTTFRSGQRNFRVTESATNTYDADAISFSDKTFVSSGITVNKTTLVDTVFNVDVESSFVGTLTSDRVISSTTRREVGGTYQVDPLAQTFFVDSQVYPNGIFLDSVDLYFRAKDSGNIPVTMQIRPTVNGYPSSDYWIPESVTTKYPSEITVSEKPSSTDKTRFSFYSPVFLKPGVYSFVVLTNSPEYTVWEAVKGATTTNNEYVSTQPYLGTLYKSQNAMEYVPYINEDLMFTVNRCKFTTDALATYYFENENLSEEINVDKIRLLESSITPLSEGVAVAQHSIVTKLATGTKEVTYRDVTPHVIYNFGWDDVYALGYRRRSIKNRGDVRLKIDMSSTSDHISPIISNESLYLNAWENFIDNAEINSTDFTIIEQGSGYANSNTITITSSTGDGATANLVVNGSGNVVSINVMTTGSNYLDDFSISYYENPADPATIVLNSEYDSSGGPCLARYITKPIVLADGYDAGDLRVFLSGNKPGDSAISVFYKILNSDDATEFNNRPYEKMVCLNPSSTASKTDYDFTEYEFRPSATNNFVTYTSGGGVTYDSFKTFAVKIVLTSVEPALSPKVRDLRIIALPAE